MIDMYIVLGIDGGGTSTTCLIADEKGNVLGRGVGGPSNFHVVGIDNAKKAILESVEDAKKNGEVTANKFDVACLGMAGGDRPKDREIIKKGVESLGVAEKIIVESDVLIAFLSAIPKGYGIVVISGTGSIAYGINRRGEKRRAGGWGYKLGDEGSGYYIGRRAITSILRERDGRSKSTRLTFRLKEYFGIEKIEEILNIVYEQGLKTKEIAALAPIVMKEAESGDEVSRGIVVDAAKELALLAKAVSKGLGMQHGSFEIALLGSVFKAGPVILDPLKKEIRNCIPNARMTLPSIEPVQGAVKIALKNLEMPNKK
ncbi:MAG TPA: hypothetical protein HA348_00275 [Thermoplasmata archaeon]|nr:hypothetical protein [Thermoplasmata archaeon]